MVHNDIIILAFDWSTMTLCLFVYLLLSSSNIMAGVNLLPPPPQVREVGTVEEWLGVLQLDHLAARFSDYSLQKLSNLWDVELATVRLLYSPSPFFFLPSPHSPSLHPLPPPSTSLPFPTLYTVFILYSSVNLTCCAMTSHIRLVRGHHSSCI